MPLAVGQMLQNRYRIEALLGQGGFGAVYRAVDLNINFRVAIKENLDASPEAQRQFAREAALLVRLRHPSLPRVMDTFFIPGWGSYLVMDLIEGQTLQDMLDHSGAIDEARAIAWMSQVLDALAYLHTQTPPIIHRDLKPANIVVTPEGRATLVDFGIAKVYDPNLLTTAGARAVTPGYSPWEQYKMTGTDTRSDVYAAGATLYALLTGHVPPESIDLMGGMAKLTPPRTFSPRMSPNVEVAILRAMNEQPSTRYADAGQMLMALSADHTPHPVKAMPMKTGTQYSSFRQRLNTRWLTLIIALFAFGTAAIYTYSVEGIKNNFEACIAQLIFFTVACLLYGGAWWVRGINLFRILALISAGLLALRVASILNGQF